MLTAQQQRKVFGRVIFGKKKIAINANDQCQVTGSYRVCFGTDFVTFGFDFATIADLANNPEKAVRF